MPFTSTQRVAVPSPSPSEHMALNGSGSRLPCACARRPSVSFTQVHGKVHSPRFACRWIGAMHLARRLDRYTRWRFVIGPAHARSATTDGTLPPERLRVCRVEEPLEAGLTRDRRAPDRLSAGTYSSVMRCAWWTLSCHVMSECNGFVSAAASCGSLLRSPLGWARRGGSRRPTARSCSGSARGDLVCEGVRAEPEVLWAEHNSD